METLIGGIIFFSPIWLAIIIYLVFRRQLIAWKLRSDEKKIERSLEQANWEEKYIQGIRDRMEREGRL